MFLKLNNNPKLANPITGTIVDGIAGTVDKLFIKSCPLLDGYANLKSIYEYQKTHQDDIKYDIVVNTQVWQNIIALHPEFEQLAANHHKLAVYIYYNDNPASIAADLADLIADHPDLADVIAAYPDVRHSIISTTKRANILIPNEISGYMNGIIIPYSWSQLTKVEMGIKAFVNNGVWQLLEEWVNNSVGGGRVAYGYTSRFNVSNMTTISDRTVFNDVTIEFTYNSTNPGHLFSWTDAGSSRKMCAEYVKLYDLNNNLVMHLVPYVKDNVVGFIDLVNTTRFLTNTGTGTFTYILEDR